MWLTWGYTFTLNLGTCISCCVGACVRLRYYMWLLQFSYQVLITWDEHIWQRDLLLLELFIGLSRRQFRMKLILILHFRALSNSLSPRTKVKGYSQRRDWTVLTGFLPLCKSLIELFSGRPSAFTIHKSMFFYLGLKDHIEANYYYFISPSSSWLGLGQTGSLTTGPVHQPVPKLTLGQVLQTLLSSFAPFLNSKHLLGFGL